MSLRKYYKVIDTRENLEIPNPNLKAVVRAPPLKRILMVVLLAVKGEGGDRLSSAAAATINRAH